MAEAQSLKINSDGTILTKGKLTFITAGERLAQKLTIRLSILLTEWFLDERVGVPWLDVVLVKNPSPAAVDAVIREVIVTTPQVASLDVLETSLDSATRILSVTVQGTLDDGTPFDLQFNQPVLPTVREAAAQEASP